MPDPSPRPVRALALPSVRPASAARRRGPTWAAVLALTVCGPACSSAPKRQDSGVRPAPATESGQVESCLPPPASIGTCGSASTARDSLIPGPGHPDFDADLDAKARRFDRVFHAFHTRNTGLNTELALPDDGGAARAQIQQWVAEDDGWDFEAWAGVPVTDVVASWAKVAGAYGGVGLAADAYRYGALRDEGADCEEVSIAREQLLAGLDGLHLAVAITGEPGVIARGFASTDNPGHYATIETTPLFDDAGAPLPEDKNNGTWRADSSGLYPTHVWEDSCSRDMLVGWAAGFGAAWEVVRADPEVPDAVKVRLADDARAVATSLLEVQDSGYDLEIMDADGRTTYHGLLHENSIDRYYLPSAENGQNALMALGIVGALAAAAEDDALLDLVTTRLVQERELGRIARDTAYLVDLGAGANFSGYNMGFLGGWLAQRWVCDAGARDDVATGVVDGMYDRPGESRQPAEQSQALYHLVAAQSASGASIYGPGASPDPTPLERTLQVLRAFSDAPYFPEARINCDADEIAAGVCTALDGSTLHLLGEVGWNDTLVSDEPVPMSIRPASNYHWRSNPYQVNGDPGSSAFLSGVDFRFVYWMGRYIQR